MLVGLNSERFYFKSNFMFSATVVPLIKSNVFLPQKSCSMISFSSEGLNESVYIPTHTHTHIQSLWNRVHAQQPIGGIDEKCFATNQI